MGTTVRPEEIPARGPAIDPRRVAWSHLGLELYDFEMRDPGPYALATVLPQRVGSGWRIEAIAPLSRTLGPQAAGVRSIAWLLHREIDIVRPAEADHYRAARGVARHNGSHTAFEAAVRALDQRGTDIGVWADPSKRLYGEELVAIAARDLLSTVAGWDGCAYDLLTGPCRSVFGRRKAARHL
ncbi:hypothetical protein GCM10027169_27520 [Gordonia jinhuaensis]|uniref:Uncharacterized protein n=1 Tax=Gordonia jinhuaensis TaxID=1517702 RepID=A0A916TA29_9ACTN|nr:hypothetical protein [Gordonia jinhuaensis]GGB37459.1 hypothetical protein GCM10011489_26610 [Gordonia jinhuaensis]